jgi:hypothetical protein
MNWPRWNAKSGWVGQANKTMEIDATHLENLVQRQMFEDPSGGIFNKRIMLQFFQMAQNTNMPEKERADVFDLLHVITLKFVSVWTHDQRFDKKEKEMIAATEANPIDRRKNVPMRIVSGQELYIEWDGFLVQSKSVLDHMVKILHYGLGIQFSNLTSFKDDGNGIIKILNGNVGANPPNKRRAAKLLIKHIQNNQDWLKGMIEARDRMNHFQHGGMSPMAFGVASIIEKDGIQTLHRPRMTPDQIVKEVMTTLMNNLLEFIEYFLGISIAVRAPDYAVQWHVTDDPMKLHCEMIHGAIVEHMIKTRQLDPNKIN